MSRISPKLYEEVEKAIFFCKYMELAERLKTTSEDVLKKEIREEEIRATAFLIYSHGKWSKRIDPSQLAEAWENILTLTDHAKYPLAYKTCTGNKPKRFWFWLWINFAKTRAREIFRELFEKGERNE